METIIIILFVIVSFALTFFIILQPGKGGGMGALGGGGGSGGGPGGSMFGARGAVPFLAKMTVWFGIAFGVLVLVLARLNIDRPTIGLDAPEAVIPTESLPGGGAGAPEGAEGGVVVPTDGEAPADPAAGEAPTEAPEPAPAAADPAGEENVDRE